jgi:hypothetical protein
VFLFGYTKIFKAPNFLSSLQQNMRARGKSTQIKRHLIPSAVRGRPRTVGNHWRSASGYGTVFVGWNQEGTPFAIKRLKSPHKHR